MSFSKKAKDQRKSAVRFLKSVTPCTACQQKGHWAGDPECFVKKGKGRGKTSSPSAKKKGQPPKRKSPATTLLALHDAEPDRQDHDVPDAAMVEPPTAEAEECYMADDLNAPRNVKASEYRYDPTNLNGTGTSDGQDVSHGIYTLAAYVVNDFTYQKLPGPVAFRHICDASETDGSAESFMALNCPKLCEHSSYRGGEEHKLHRGAHGHTRHVTCKERGCDRTIIVGHRKEPVEMWSYLVQILLCTKWRVQPITATVHPLVQLPNILIHLKLSEPSSSKPGGHPPDGESLLAEACYEVPHFISPTWLSFTRYNIHEWTWMGQTPSQK